MLQYQQTARECLAVLDSAIASTHSVDARVVRAFALRRDPMFDAGVLGGFALLYVGACALVGRMVAARAARDDRATLTLDVLGAALLLAFAGMVIGELWSISLEMVRVGNSHLSSRTARIPWVEHRAVIAAIAFALAAGVVGRYAGAAAKKRGRIPG